MQLKGVKPGRIPSFLQFIVGMGMIAVAWITFKDHKITNNESKN